jgi:hypothetical protein
MPDDSRFVDARLHAGQPKEVAKLGNMAIFAEKAAYLTAGHQQVVVNMAKLAARSGALLAIATPRD